MKVAALGKLRDGVVASNRGDRHLRLEGRCVIATRTFQDDLLLSRGFFAPQQVKSSHKPLFGYPGPPPPSVEAGSQPVCQSADRMGRNATRALPRFSLKSWPIDVLSDCCGFTIVDPVR